MSKLSSLSSLSSSSSNEDILSFARNSLFANSTALDCLSNRDSLEVVSERFSGRGSLKYLGRSGKTLGTASWLALPNHVISSSADAAARTTTAVWRRLMPAGPLTLSWLPAWPGTSWIRDPMDCWCAEPPVVGRSWSSSFERPPPTSPSSTPPILARESRCASRSPVSPLVH